MYLFRPLIPGPREANYGNTVLVQREVGVWLLGYIQDIEADNFLINFSSTTTPTAWIHSRCVWAHYFARYTSADSGDRTGGVPLYVALRDDDNGPYRFRPGTLLSRFCSIGLIYVQFNSGPLAIRAAVHRWQIVKELPDLELPLFTRTTGLTYVKHVVPFDNMHLYSVENINERKVCKSLVNARWPANIYYSPFGEPSGQIVRDNGCRFHLRFENNSFVFICAEFLSNRPNKQLFWNPEFLKSQFEIYFARYQVCGATNACRNDDEIKTTMLPSAACSFRTILHRGKLEDSVGFSGLSPKRSFTEENFTLGHLALPIHVDILRCMDLHAQAKMKRVCVAWYRLLDDSDTKRHIIVDINNFARNLFDDWANLTRPSTVNHNPGHQLASLLNHTVTSETRSLILINGDDNFRLNEFLLTELLMLKMIKLPRIILQDWSATSAFLPGNPDPPESDYCGSVSKLIRVCDRLILLNYSATNIFEMSTTILFNWDEGVREPSFPHHEAEFVRNPDTLFKLVCKIQIPRLSFRQTETHEEMIRKFLSTSDNCCPSVDNTVYDKVTAVLHRWVNTLNYPDEWEAIRDLLNLYNGFHADGSTRSWNDVDLRQLDVSRLNTLTLRAITIHFRDKADSSD